MSDAPERIWAWRWLTQPIGQWQAEPSTNVTLAEYTRADLATAAETAAREEGVLLRYVLEGIKAAWGARIANLRVPHVLILEDGTRHSGPAVDFLARLADAQITLIDAALTADPAQVAAIAASVKGGE